ncbi:hypothetical protein [Plantactinospora sp. GCM10030261]|uniref:hypothetical protein n=1 Tax=Plantactinospora sp. GCM10030261 TaxID=3273420 RepID=UPI003615BBBB
MSRHDEPNEYGFAGEGTAPEPPPAGERDEVEAAEAVAVPGGDLTAEFSEALPDGPEEDGRHRTDRARGRDTGR